MRKTQFDGLGPRPGRATAHTPGIAVALCLSALTHSADAQAVAIRNLSYPGTGLEPGDTVAINITGGAPNGAVTVVTNGAPPYFYGYADSNGSWAITNTVVSGDVGSWTEVWYVNGVQLTPVNPNTTYVPYAPRLPAFTVYANHVGSNRPSQSTSQEMSACGTAVPGGWKYTPVAYYSYSSTVSSSDVNTAAGSWNSLGSKISLSNDSYGAIWLVDGSATSGPNGTTEVVSGDCDTCYGYLDLCQGVSPGECVDASGEYGAQITLEPNVISMAASALGATEETLADITVTHELGHALRLAHSTLTNGTCSEVQSIMYPSLSVLYGCGVTSPTSSCDAGALNTVYPSTPPTCSPVGTNFCEEGYYC
jgi:hypothetical protein